MWKKGLIHKIVTVFTIIVAVAILLLAMIVSMWSKHIYIEQKRQQLDNQGKLIGQKFIEYTNKYPYREAYEDELKSDMNFIGTYVDADVFLVDALGYVSVVSSSEYMSLKFSNILSSDIDELRLGNVIEKKNEYNDMFGKKVYIYMKPIMDNGVFKGAVALFIPMNQLYLSLRKIYVIIWVAAIITIIIVSVIIYYFTKRMILNPLAEINKAAKKISKGEVERRVHLKSKDEISELAESFNTMADSLEKVERNRREFISNVSHELRSPITSIKGFIGGILDGVIPKDKESYYLSIAFEEIQRLTRLVNDLLDLSAMEAGKFTLNIADIDINEIIRLCVIKFETRINMKKLTVDVNLQDEHLYVVADRDRLIQISTNLLDNAIKYVGDGGYIRITSRTRGDKVLVSLYDDGPKIQDDDLKHIWERFYKADKSRTSKLSTGLGLPIVRNILTQLGEDIWVENGEKAGVTFYFTLKKS